MEEAPENQKPMFRQLNMAKALNARREKLAKQKAEREQNPITSDSDSDEDFDIEIVKKNKGGRPPKQKVIKDDLLNMYNNIQKMHEDIKSLSQNIEEIKTRRRKPTKKLIPIKSTPIEPIAPIAPIAPISVIKPVANEAEERIKKISSLLFA